MGPVEGYLVDRLGARRMVMMGLLILACGFLLFSQVQSLWVFYLSYVIMAVGQGFWRLADADDDAEQLVYPPTRYRDWVGQCRESFRRFDFSSNYCLGD